MTSTFTCPHCKKPIELTEALRHELEEQLSSEYAKRIEEAVQKARLEEAQKIKKESSGELKVLQETLAEKEKKLDEARRFELEVRKQKIQFEEEKKEFELKVQRQIDSERKKIAEDEYKKAHEEMLLKDKEKDKKLEDLQKALQEAQRKASQGSQQTQGEVLELHLENTLRTNFIHDEIKEVPKGIRGADVLQVVRTPRGTVCGTIIWESKRTKAWSDSWVAKLKEDQRSVIAEQAVLVTEVLPKGVRHFDFVNGIWVCDYESIKGVALMLRKALIEVTGTKLASVGKNEKMESVYEYLTGTGFRQRVEAIVEACINMKADIDREKRAYDKIWAKREKEIESLLGNTVKAHGDLQGIMGKSLPEIKSLALESGEDAQLFTEE